jgi:hypothetical protein
MGIDPVSLALIGGGLSAAQSVAGNRANDSTARNIRGAGR